MFIFLQEVLLQFTLNLRVVARWFPTFVQVCSAPACYKVECNVKLLPAWAASGGRVIGIKCRFPTFISCFQLTFQIIQFGSRISKHQSRKLFWSKPCHKLLRHTTVHFRKIKLRPEINDALTAVKNPCGLKLVHRT